VELLACPTCGRLETDVAPVVETLERALAEVPCDAPLTVAVMGCVVNGPGEAEDADLAVCCGREKALLYRRGEKVCTLRPAEIAPRLLAEVRRLCENGAENEKTSPEHTS
jgi:(E)-4-hydroxy-3-methylbut-2-enyl-diphosphate synthase